MTDLTQRKNEHLNIVLGGQLPLRKATSGFERWRFEHCALPEMSLDEIDITTSLFGRPLQAPLLISSMTGGASRADAINRHLAEAAQHLGIAMGVGSQRVALETDSQWGLTRDLRRYAPNAVLMANLGAAQIVGAEGLTYAHRAVDMLEADALIIHLNPLQEALQHDGDRNWRGVLRAIEQTASTLAVPVVIKEVGAGISVPVARQLVDAGVAMLDVAGVGGTSWAAIEGERATTVQGRSVAMAFADWGIATATALEDLHTALPTTPLVASGGIYDGVVAAKALRLGASLVGQAAAALPGALDSTQAVVDHFRTVIAQLRVACFCTASANLTQLRRAVMVRAS